MRFYLRKKRQPPAVIIVALIDVLIVVLIFLMVTTTFKKPMASLRLALPESTHATKAGANENAPLIVSIEATGILRIGDGALPITSEDLKAELEKRLAANPSQKLAISADKKAPWEKIVQVMDATRDAGFKASDISVFTKAAGTK